MTILKIFIRFSRASGMELKSIAKKAGVGAVKRIVDAHKKAE